MERPEDGDEGFTYRSVGDDLWIYGGKQRGTMYGVYSFLENELGVPVKYLSIGPDRDQTITRSI